MNLNSLLNTFAEKFTPEQQAEPESRKKSFKKESVISDIAGKSRRMRTEVDSWCWHLGCHWWLFFYLIEISLFLFNQREICMVMKDVYDLIGVYIFVNTYETVHSNLYSLMYVYIMSHFFKTRWLFFYYSILVTLFKSSFGIIMGLEA